MTDRQSLQWLSAQNCKERKTGSPCSMSSTKLQGIMFEESVAFNVILLHIHSNVLTKCRLDLNFETWLLMHSKHQTRHHFVHKYVIEATLPCWYRSDINVASINYFVVTINYYLSFLSVYLLWLHACG